MRKRRLREYILSKKYYLSLIGCLIITLIVVGIIYNRNQKYEEIANLNEVKQSLVENPDSNIVDNNNEDILATAETPQVTIHSEDVVTNNIDENTTTTPDITIEDDTSGEDVTSSDSASTETTSGDLSSETSSSDTAATDTTVTEETGNQSEDDTVTPPDLLSNGDEDDGTLETFEPVIEVKQPNLKFDTEAGMTLPITGDILINYSGNNPVYFKTLDQYKISQGLYIAAEVGSEVEAAADGVVEKIEKQANKGNMITIYHGNGFKTVYAQLKEDMNVKEGDLVYKGDIIGYVEKPTSYYVLEGPHLYFEVQENGKAIDPSPLIK